MKLNSDSNENTYITIGMCVKNGASTINDSINSIINQDFPHENIEIIFVDDGSEDNSLTILRKYYSLLDMKVKIYHHSWKGLGYSRNIVVKNATGKYIVWIDADMIMAKNYISKLVEYMDNNNKVAIAKGRFKLNPEANMISTLEKYSRAAGRMVDFNNIRARALGTGGAIYRVKSIRDVGGFDENIKGHGEDLDAELRVKAKGWMLSAIDTWFLDRERFGMTWSDIWYNYFNRGRSLYYLAQKYEGLIILWKMSPFSAFFAGLLNSIKLYRLVHRKEVFLLPIQYFYKMTAWCLGFIKASRDAMQKNIPI